MLLWRVMAILPLISKQIIHLSRNKQKKKKKKNNEISQQFTHFIFPVLYTQVKYSQDNMVCSRNAHVVFVFFSSRQSFQTKASSA